MNPVDAIIPGQLYQGRYYATRYLRRRPDLHIHCARELASSGPVAFEHVWLPLADAKWDWRQHPGEVRRLKDVADHAGRVIRAGGRVLTTCHMGINRSGLLSGLILVRAYGLTGDEAIERVRQGHGSIALSNRSFREFLRSN
jgi:protein-tyrosine phosphatase